MIIGIDTSRAFVSDKTGTENYSYYVVKYLLRLPESQQHTFVLFIRPNAVIPDWTAQKNVQIKLIKNRILWTQVGLALATWQNKLDTLWIPAHTLPLLRPSNLRTVVTIHGLEYKWLKEYRNFLQRWYLPLSTYYAAAYATQLIAVSHHTKDQLVKELHTSPNKIKVIYEGVEIGQSDNSAYQRAGKLENQNILRKYGLQEKHYILFVGSVQPRKNLEQLIEAFATVSRTYPNDKLVVAGAIGWMAEAILTAPQRTGIQEKVVFTGRVSQETLQRLYRDAWAYVQPSLTEGFGLPILEAMQAGVPVISSDGGALSEVVGRAGVIVPLSPHFVQNLATAIKRLSKDRKRQNELIIMGYKNAKLFSWQSAAKQTFKVLLG